MTTVYILGAGASKHVGYPLITEMGKQWLEWMALYPNGRYVGSVDFLVERHGTAPNIEDVITDLDSTIDSLADSAVSGDKSKRMRIGTVRGQMSESLREWFREIHLRPASAYAEFADHVIQAGDVVISFNYDDSLERELRRTGKWDLSQGYGFALGNNEQSSPVLMLKPHGSINWLASIFGGAMSGPMQINLSGGTFGQHPVIHKADTEYLGYADFSGHTYPGGGALVSMILPGRNKEFCYHTTFGDEWGPFFSHLWSQAKRALKRADKVIICGYGMQTADKQACDMILNEPSKQSKVEIVCGSRGKLIADDFRNAGYKDVSFDATGRFEEWVHAAHDGGGE